MGKVIFINYSGSMFVDVAEQEFAVGVDVIYW